jgi:hypothetical protein
MMRIKRCCGLKYFELQYELRGYLWRLSTASCFENNLTVDNSATKAPISVNDRGASIALEITLASHRVEYLTADGCWCYV